MNVALAMGDSRKNLGRMLATAEISYVIFPKALGTGARSARRVPHSHNALASFQQPFFAAVVSNSIR